jgi:hypothetical protein
MSTRTIATLRDEDHERYLRNGFTPEPPTVPGNWFMALFFEMEAKDFPDDFPWKAVAPGQSGLIVEAETYLEDGELRCKYVRGGKTSADVGVKSDDYFLLNDDTIAEQKKKWCTSFLLFKPKEAERDYDSLFPYDTKRGVI